MSTWEEVTRPENFNKFVIILLNGAHLVIGGHLYRLGEIELYYFTDKHQDFYVHRDKLQQTFGQVYFHRFKGGSYRGGTRRGMDFTFGSPGSCLGILIRTIQNISSGQVITGPSNTVGHILQVLGYESIDDLMTAAGGTINFLQQNKFIYLCPKELCSNEAILHGPRVGLKEKYPQFQMLPYRFVSETVLKDIKKQKKQLRSYFRPT